MTVDLRIFTEPQQGATYDDLLAVARAAEDLGFSGFFRSDHYLHMGGTAGPGPTDAWTTLAGTGPRDLDDPARHAGHVGHLPAARVRWRSQVAGVDQMSGGRVELGLGAGWFEAEHTAYGIPFPPLGERFDRLEEQLAVITGLWDDRAGSDVQPRRRPLPGHRLPRPAPSRCRQQRRADHHRWWRQATHPGAGRAVCRRVQCRRSCRPPTPAGSSSGSAPWPARGRARPGLADLLGRPGRLRRAATRRPCADAPTPSDATSTSCAPTAWRARPTRSWRSSRRSRPRAPSGSTSRSSTSPTSTTWPTSRTACCASSPDARRAAAQKCPPSSGHFRTSTHAHPPPLPQRRVVTSARPPTPTQSPSPHVEWSLPHVHPRPPSPLPPRRVVTSARGHPLLDLICIGCLCIFQRVTEPTTLGNDLLRSAARLSRWASRHASFDVPFAQARLLALLDELGPSRVSTLAAADHSSQPTITTQLQRLEASGWVDRASDPDDARATVISLSAEGHAALESVRRARLAVLVPRPRPARRTRSRPGPRRDRRHERAARRRGGRPAPHPTRKDG